MWAAKPVIIGTQRIADANEAEIQPFIALATRFEKADRPPRQVAFQEPNMAAYESTASLPHEFGGMGSNYDDEEVEKLPLTAAQGGLYPPGPIDPNAYGDPYDRPISVVSTASSGVESAWRRRQTIKRGVTRKVKLTKGNFIAEYPVPTPVYSAIEPKWLGSKTTEFSYVFSA
ncbi:predicted protein [Postia placenta Mad-698-R]|nr:predicted protein [Postia placenta Mad-698-R]